MATEMSGSDNHYEWISAAPRPWLVVDLCALEGLPRSETLPTTFSVVLPHRLFFEAATSSRPRKLLHKAEQFLTQHSMLGRVLIGRDPLDVASREICPQDVRTEIDHVIDIETSDEVREAQVRGEVLDLSKMDEIVRSDEAVDEAKRFFNQTSVNYAKWARNERPEMLSVVSREFQSNAPRWEHVARVAETAVALHPRYQSADWQSELSSFPTRSAVARYLQIYAWYMSLRAARADTADAHFGNNFDDLHYVFLASYTNHLRTDDKGMASACISLFGEHLRVHPTWEEFTDPSSDETEGR